MGEKSAAVVSLLRSSERLHELLGASCSKPVGIHSDIPLEYCGGCKLLLSKGFQGLSASI
jgi:hypothetical protein